MGPRWLQLCYFAEWRSPKAKWHNCSHQGTITFDLPRDSNGDRIYCFIYAIHIFIVHWLVKRFLENSRNLIVNIIMIMLIVFWLMYPACSKRRVYSASRLRYTQTRHHRVNHLRAWKDYLRVEKDYLRLWPSFFRIVSLFLITWRTFNQSMDKNIWMPYIKLLYLYNFSCCCCCCCCRRRRRRRRFCFRLFSIWVR